MKLVIYGTDTCKDCVDAKALLDAKGDSLSLS
ncbi:MAG: glutaredoxin domain-containing protein [Coprococcus sp.]